MARIRQGELPIVRISCLPSVSPRVAQLLADFSASHRGMRWSLITSLRAAIDRRSTSWPLRYGDLRSAGRRGHRACPAGARTVEGCAARQPPIGAHQQLDTRRPCRCPLSGIGPWDGRLCRDATVLRLKRRQSSAARRSQTTRVWCSTWWRQVNRRRPRVSLWHSWEGGRQPSVGNARGRRVLRTLSIGHYGPGKPLAGSARRVAAARRHNVEVHRVAAS